MKVHSAEPELLENVLPFSSVALFFSQRLLQYQGPMLRFLNICSLKNRRKMWRCLFEIQRVFAKLGLQHWFVSKTLFSRRKLEKIAQNYDYKFTPGDYVTISRSVV
jgi:hypothetical protein